MTCGASLLSEKKNVENIQFFCGKPKPTIVRLMVNNTTSRTTISTENKINSPLDIVHVWVCMEGKRKEN